MQRFWLIGTMSSKNWFEDIVNILWHSMDILHITLCTEWPTNLHCFLLQNILKHFMLRIHFILKSYFQKTSQILLNFPFSCLFLFFFRYIVTSVNRNLCTFFNIFFNIRNTACERSLSQVLHGNLQASLIHFLQHFNYL